MVFLCFELLLELSQRSRDGDRVPSAMFASAADRSRL